MTGIISILGARMGDPQSFKRHGVCMCLWLQDANQHRGISHRCLIFYGMCREKSRLMQKDAKTEAILHHKPSPFGCTPCMTGRWFAETLPIMSSDGPPEYLGYAATADDGAWAGKVASNLTRNSLETPTSLGTLQP